MKEKIMVEVVEFTEKSMRDIKKLNFQLIKTVKLSVN